MPLNSFFLFFMKKLKKNVKFKRQVTLKFFIKNETAHSLPIIFILPTWLLITAEAQEF